MKGNKHREKRYHSYNGKASGARSRRTTALYGLGVAAIIVVAGLVINEVHSRAKYSIFVDHRELFEAVKDEAERLVSHLDDLEESGVTILYRNGGNANIDQFHDMMSDSLHNKIQQITALSGYRLTFLKYNKQEGTSYISFVFDWEMAYGDSYHIVYCKSQSEIVKVYESESFDYVLDKLDEDWFGIGLK